MGQIYGENTIRDEFSNWLDEVASELQEADDNCLRKYYVYALCEQIDDGSLIPFYIGKGTGDRVWHHADETEKEKEAIREEARKYNLSEHEVNLLFETLTEKQQRINDIDNNRFKRIIIKSGLTEYESFMCESALINLLRLSGIYFTNGNKLTNKYNGHSNSFEKKAEIEPSALFVEEYYKRYCKEPIIYNSMNEEQLQDFADKKIMLRNINKSYSQCIDPDKFPTDEEKDEAIKEAVRGFWVEGDLEKMDYVFAMYEGRIKGVYKVKKREKDELPHVYDLWRADYPIFDKLPVRKKDYTFAKLIYDDLISQNLIILNDGRPTKTLTTQERKRLFTLLSEDTKKTICRFISDSDFEEWLKERRKKEPALQDDKETRECFYNNYLRSWSLRKYYILEDLVTGIDPNFKKYINCSIKVSRDDMCESIFTRKKVQKSDGSYIRCIFRGGGAACPAWREPRVRTRRSHPFELTRF